MNESGSWSYSLLELIFVMSLFSLTELWQECDSADFSLSTVLLLYWAQHINWYTGQGILNILTDICLIKITTSVVAGVGFLQSFKLCRLIFPTLKKRPGKMLLMHKTLWASQMKARIYKYNACLLPLLWWKVAAFCLKWD